MHDVPIPEDRVVDPQGIGNPGYSRDPERTPMQWSAAPNAGFCPQGVEPWLPLADDYRENNVEAQENDPTSMLSLVRRLLSLRRELPALAPGSYRSLETGAETFAYLREHEGQKVLVALNFGQEEREIDLSAVGASGEVLCSTHPDREGEARLDGLRLRLDEGVAVRLVDAT
jgi:alpha-glucosidase